MDKIKVVYVDDELDSNISRYLKKSYRHKDFEKEYEEVCFNSAEGYDSLISNQLIKEANIILIDSKLFENDRVTTGKFSGEEFKMILKKVFPFIEVIVITQNELEEDYGTISKYREGFQDNPQQYYAEKLKKVLDAAIQNINIYRNIADKLIANDGIDKVLIEKIVDSLEGSAKYDELTTTDIDDIILAFKELQGDIDGE
ncbi:MULTISPECIES: hypothetical protein [Clostridium]|uniref:Response regulator receiver domain-containing protein n=1 Tax=Clostridium frigoriphilum TaxID=443253 RepID=A0ABU7UJI1_9CLOT|nr:hypothetical protein [Clostridium sp. DSM 17811]MBU3098076.1 hypothetical protein [Clostridium sp. DSM 17811]